MNCLFVLWIATSHHCRRQAALSSLQRSHYPYCCGMTLPCRSGSPFPGIHVIRFVSVLLSICCGRYSTTHGLVIRIVSFWLSPLFRATYTKNIVECTIHRGSQWSFKAGWISPTLSRQPSEGQWKMTASHTSGSFQAGTISELWSCRGTDRWCGQFPSDAQDNRRSRKREITYSPWIQEEEQDWSPLYWSAQTL